MARLSFTSFSFTFDVFREFESKMAKIKIFEISEFLNSAILSRVREIAPSRRAINWFLSDNHYYLDRRRWVSSRLDLSVLMNSSLSASKTIEKFLRNAVNVFFYFNLFRMNFSSNSGDSNWIDNNLSKRGNNFLCRVDEAFIADNFNLYGLTSLSNGAVFYRVNIRDFRRSDMPMQDDSLYLNSWFSDFEENFKYRRWNWRFEFNAAI